jgi:hypothetical protein
MHSNLKDAMRLFPLLVSRHDFQIGLQSFLAGLFPLLTTREEIRDVPPHLLRDIGLGEDRGPGRDELLR